MNRCNGATYWKYLVKCVMIGMTSVMVSLWGTGLVHGQELDLNGAPALAFQQEQATGHLKITISARTPLDFSLLLQNVDDDDSIESAYAKIDRVRNKQYPKQEMLLALANLDPAPQTCAVINLRKKIIWFNSSHPHGSRWIAANIDSGAACCVVKVTQGKYSLYYENPNGTWTFGGATGAGGLWAATTYGSNLYRGFKGLATASGTSKSDIVMYYYY